MFFKLFVFVTLLSGGIAYIPNCKVEVEEVETQVCMIKPTKVCVGEEDGDVMFHRVHLEPLCVDVVDKMCVPAAVPADGCQDVTRKVCLTTSKLMDTPICPGCPKPEPDSTVPPLCHLLPRGTCEARMMKVPKTVCEPVELPDPAELPKFYYYRY